MRILLVLVTLLLGFVGYAIVSSGSGQDARRVAAASEVDAPRPTAPPAVAAATAPVRSADVVPSTPDSTPGPTAVEGVEGLTIDEAVARIAATRGRPSLVVFYGTHCPITQSMFSELAAMTRRHPDVAVLAFAADNDDELAGEVPGFLRQHGADYSPMFIREWPRGTFYRSVAPLGIQVDTSWTLPLVAIRDASGRVVAQGEAVTDVAGVEASLSRLR